MVNDSITQRHVKELLRRYPDLEKASEQLIIAYSILKNCFFNDRILFVCGNGGSASDSEHIVGELMKGFKMKRPVRDAVREDFRNRLGSEELADKLQMGLRAVSLLSHPALSSAYVNDVDPLMTYAQQLFVMGREGDALIGLSTSGNARNIYNAFQVARVKKIKTILFTGENHGICEEFSDCVIHAPSRETYVVQEYHLPMYHCLCLMLEEAFYGNGN